MKKNTSQSRVIHHCEIVKYLYHVTRDELLQEGGSYCAGYATNAESQSFLHLIISYHFLNKHLEKVIQRLK